MEIVSSDDHDTFDDLEEDFDEDQTHVSTFIASEHVSLTEELMQTHESALKRLNLILRQIGCECDNDKSPNLLAIISKLETAVKDRLLWKREENENNSDILENENDLLDTDNITDEKQILEVKLKNSETLLERCKRKSEKLILTSKESDRKLNQLTSQLTTADLKNRLFEDQVKMLERDLKAQNQGTSDNLNDAIEERNVAVKEKNEAWIELSITKGELIQTNQQLLEVISQKVKLGQQLETWQIDMQKVLEEQIELKLAKKL